MHYIKKVYGKGAVKLLSEYRAEEEILEDKSITTEEERKNILTRNEKNLEFFVLDSSRNKLREKLLGNN